jgi:hypothetical protein
MGMKCIEGTDSHILTKHMFDFGPHQQVLPNNIIMQYVLLISVRG